MNVSELANSLRQLLGTIPEPVAVTFLNSAPAGIERVTAPAPAGCSYWKLAADGGVFYTVGADHVNCPIGAYTHGAELGSDTEAQLHQMIGKMVGLLYLKAYEVPGISRRNQPLHFIVYAPLSKQQETPDVVLLRGNARQVMLLAEAANARDLMSQSSIMGRPACSVIAATIETGKVTTSLGCIGNRVYTQLRDDEFYLAVPGAAIGDLVESLRSIVTANSDLEQYHLSKCASV